MKTLNLNDGRILKILSREDVNTTNSEYDTPEINSFFAKYKNDLEKEFGDKFLIPANTTEFYENNKDIIDAMFDIVYSNEKLEDRLKETPKSLKDKKEKYTQDIADLFLDDSNALIFILYNLENKPCSLAVMSTERDNKNNLWNLEMIETKKGEEFKSMQYGSSLLKNAVNYIIKNKNAKFLTSSIECGNKPSISLHENWLTEEGFKHKVDKTNGVFKYLVNLNEKTEEKFM